MDLGEKILAWIADERQSEVKQTWLVVVKNSWTEDDDFVIQSNSTYATENVSVMN
jgi:hypothetical protein